MQIVFRFFISIRKNKSHRLGKYCSHGFQPVVKKTILVECRRYGAYNMGRTYGTRYIGCAVCQRVETRCYNIGRGYASIVSMYL
jgi:hypothetical protein